MVWLVFQKKKDTFLQNAVCYCMSLNPLQQGWSDAATHWDLVEQQTCPHSRARKHLPQHKKGQNPNVLSWAMQTRVVILLWLEVRLYSERVWCAHDRRLDKSMSYETNLIFLCKIIITEVFGSGVRSGRSNSPALGNFLAIKLYTVWKAGELSRTLAHIIGPLCMICVSAIMSNVVVKFSTITSYYLQ